MSKEIKIDHVHFDSLIGLSAYLDSNWDSWERGRKSCRNFHDCLSQTECRDILRSGGDHQPSADRMARTMLDMSKVPAGDLEFPQLINAVAGHRPNIGAFLAGSPKSMVRFKQEPQPNKSVKMFVNVAASGSVANATLLHRGAAILGAIDALQADGYAVELTVGFISVISNYGGNEFHATVKVKDFGDTWNPAAVAFTLAEPSFFRRSLFAVCNIEAVNNPKGVADQLGRSLGYPKKKSDFTDYDIEFEALHGRENWTPENAVSKAMTKVYDWLERNKAGKVA